MKIGQHVLIGSVVGATSSIIPDLVLFTYRWRRNLHPGHPLARLHRFSHSWNGLLFIVILSWGIHLLVDWFTHPPHLYGRSIDEIQWLEAEKKCLVNE